MKKIKWEADLLLCGIGGALAGLLVQAGQNTGWGMLYACGQVSMGLLPWVVLGSALSLRSRSGLHASLRVLCCFFALLLAYGASGECGGWSNPYVLTAGCVILPFAAAAAWVMRTWRSDPALRIAIGAAGVMAMLIDAVFRSGVSFRELTLMLPLLVYHFYTLSTVRPKQTCRTNLAPR